MPLWKWSKTAATNATADPAINWAEGQAPSSINDSARSMMARLAEWRDDITGAIATGGTSTAYTVSSNQGFDTLAHLDGQMIAFTPHATSGGAATLNVDSLGAKPLRTSPGIEVLSGTLIQGTPYVATYNNSDGVFYLHNVYGSNPYNVPLAAGLDYWASTTPNSNFAFPIGQAISRTTYSALFSLIGVQFGAGDGSTTFNLPNKIERVSIMKSSSASLIPVGVLNSTIIGATGGSATATIAQNNLPNVAPTFSGNSGTVNVTSNRGDIVIGANGIAASGGSAAMAGSTVTAITSSGTFTPTGSVSSINGNQTQQTMPVTQPTIVCNYIIRVI